MITKEELLDFMREKAYKPMTYQELETHLQIGDAESFKQFLKLLNQLEQDGEIIRTRTERYGVPERMNLLRGKLHAHAKGFGFLHTEDKELPDIYIHANDMNGAMNGDIVLGRITAKSAAGGRLEGEVVRIVTRAVTQLVGTFQSFESYAFVIADDKRITKDIFIPQESFHGAVTGQKVVVELVTYPEGRAAAEGRVIEILGHKDDPGVDILSIIRKYQLPESFPEAVMEEAMQVPDSIQESDLAGRRDLRDKLIVTIDGEDAKDLDDAVNVVKLPNGHYVLGVHIADVGYYVRENSELDREAYNRGTSVYLVDRVIPMLPHRLSNGICSLNPRVDRLALSCEMEFDASAQLVRHDIFSSVIRTTERMTYTNVRKLLQGEDEEITERYRDYVDFFKGMEELALKLRARRMRRGAIDFDFEEAKIIVDEEGKPTDIVKRERSIAEQIIEEFMLAANETVAEHFHWMKVPFLYRVHENPDGDKLQHFLEFITNFGYVVKGKGNTIHPRALQTLLEEIRGVKEERIISTVMLRSMKQARYDANSLGHFGLAAEFYSHFTSPIRRYPDLVIHRVIRELLLNGSLSEQRHEYLSGRMEDIAKQSSERERLAADAERDTESLKKAQYMLDKVGEEFDGIISNVTNFGIFIELDNTVEGLVRLSDLHDDYYHYHELQHALIGERTSTIFRIGDEVRVKVARVNLDETNIDFELVRAQSREKAINFVDGTRSRAGKSGRDRERGEGGRRSKGHGTDSWGFPRSQPQQAQGQQGIPASRQKGLRLPEQTGDVQEKPNDEDGEWTNVPPGRYGANRRGSGRAPATGGWSSGGGKKGKGAAGGKRGAGPGSFGGPRKKGGGVKAGAIFSGKRGGKK